MGLFKKIVVDLIEVVENGSVQVREAVRVYEDATVISQTFRRHVVAPGDSYAKEDERVQAVCKAVHTPEVIAAYDLLRRTTAAG